MGSSYFAPKHISCLRAHYQCNLAQISNQINYYCPIYGRRKWPKIELAVFKHQHLFEEHDRRNAKGR